MKKYLIIGIVVIIAVGGYFYFSNARKESEWAYINSKNWEELSNEDFDQAEHLLNRIDTKAEKITNLLNVNAPENKKLEIGATSRISKIIEQETSDDHLFLINKKMFRLGFPPFEYLLTEYVTKKSGSLTIGLASYVQDTYGDNPSFHNFGAPILSLSKEFISNENKSQIESIGKHTGVNKVSAEILSYSFVYYLIDQYGEENFIELYKSDDSEEAYLSIYNKNLNDLKDEWISYVNSQESFEHSWDDWVDMKLNNS